MSSLPADIANQALDAAGFDFSVGDLQEGTKPAQVLLRAYGQCLRQLLRAVHWNFARKQTPLVLIGDATGQTANVGTTVIAPWVYSYAYPIDCMKARFVPWSQQGAFAAPPAGNILPRALAPQAPTTPAPSGSDFNADFSSDFGPESSGNPYQAPLTGALMGGLGAAGAGTMMRPARFLEAVDPNITPPEGSQFWLSQGQSPQGSAVILTNIKNANLVYTGLMIYPSLWDAQFRAAFVAFLAAETAFPLWSAKGQAQFGMKVRDEQMKIAAQKIMQARVTDGNEGWHSSEFVPDWFRYRNSGGGRFQGGYSQALGSLGNEGIYYGGLDACCGVSGMSAF